MYEPSLFGFLILNFIGFLIILPFIAPLIIPIIVVLIVRKRKKSRNRYKFTSMMINAPDANFHIGSKLFVIFNEGTINQTQIELGIVEAQLHSQVRIALLGQFHSIDENTIVDVTVPKRPGCEYTIGEKLMVTQSRTQTPVEVTIEKFLWVTRSDVLIRKR